jgi:hypothetical protein
VVFFADACRTPSGKAELDVMGGSIFPAIRSVALVSVDELTLENVDDVHNPEDNSHGKAIPLRPHRVYATQRGPRRVRSRWG